MQLTNMRYRAKSILRLKHDKTSYNNFEHRSHQKMGYFRARKCAPLSRKTTNIHTFCGELRTFSPQTQYSCGFRLNACGLSSDLSTDKRCKALASGCIRNNRCLLCQKISAALQAPPCFRVRVLRSRGQRRVSSHQHLDLERRASGEGMRDPGVT